MAVESSLTYTPSFTLYGDGTVVWRDVMAVPPASSTTSRYKVCENVATGERAPNASPISTRTRFGFGSMVIGWSLPAVLIWFSLA